MDRSFVTFLGVSVLLIVIPGPDMALVLRNALVGGRRGGVLTALGIVTGLAAWTLASSAGVAALLLASEPAFRAVKLLGAAYLAFLGGQALLSAVRSDASSRGPIADSTRQMLTPAAAYRQGLVSNLGNPKIAVFFTSLLPQFSEVGGSAPVAPLLLGAVFCLLGLTWLVAYAIVVARVGDVLRRPRIRRAIEGCTGAVLVAFGLRLATAHR